MPLSSISYPKSDDDDSSEVDLHRKTNGIFKCVLERQSIKRGQKSNRILTTSSLVVHLKSINSQLIYSTVHYQSSRCNSSYTTKMCEHKFLLISCSRLMINVKIFRFRGSFECHLKARFQNQYLTSCVPEYLKEHFIMIFLRIYDENAYLVEIMLIID